jgi:hypothetical protein
MRMSSIDMPKCWVEDKELSFPLAKHCISFTEKLQSCVYSHESSPYAHNSIHRELLPSTQWL